MIYLADRSVFVHIPRTSGMSLCRALASHPDLETLAPSIVMGYGVGEIHRHSQAHFLRGQLSDWDRIRKVTIVRNPWRVAESMYRHFCEKHEESQAGRLSWYGAHHKEWLATVASRSFSEFVTSQLDYLRHGFFSHWCQAWRTFEDLEVEAFPYEGLDWRGLLDAMRIPFVPRPVVNKSPTSPLEWTDEAVNFLRGRCSRDFELFGYPDEP